MRHACVAFLVIVCLASCRSGPARTDRVTQNSIRQGDVCLEQGDVRGAISFFEEALDRSPDHPGALLRLGMCWERRSVVDRALELYNQLLSVAPGAPESEDAKERRDRLIRRRTGWYRIALAAGSLGGGRCVGC